MAGEEKKKPFLEERWLKGEALSDTDPKSAIQSAKVQIYGSAELAECDVMILCLLVCDRVT